MQKHGLDVAEAKLLDHPPRLVVVHEVPAGKGIHPKNIEAVVNYGPGRLWYQSLSPVFLGENIAEIFDGQIAVLGFVFCPRVVDSDGADHLSGFFVNDGKYVFLFHEPLQNGLAFFRAAVMGPACHLAHAWNRRIGKKVLKVAFQPWPQDEALCLQHNAGNVQLLLHGIPSRGQ